MVGERQASEKRGKRDGVQASKIPEKGNCFEGGGGVLNPKEVLGSERV